MTRAEVDALWKALQAAKLVPAPMAGITVNYGRDVTEATEAEVTRRLALTRTRIQILLDRLDVVDAVRVADMAAVVDAARARASTTDTAAGDFSRQQQGGG